MPNKIIKKLNIILNNDHIYIYIYSSRFKLLPMSYNTLNTPPGDTNLWKKKARNIMNFLKKCLIVRNKKINVTKMICDKNCRCCNHGDLDR